MRSLMVVAAALGLTLGASEAPQGARAGTRADAIRAAKAKTAQAARSTKVRAAPAQQKASTARARAPQSSLRKSATRNRRPASASRTQSRRTAQLAPTRERYLEIQQALIERGYLSPPATGNWGPESVEALKRFQQEHHLEPTGTLNALTLIALGLGPKRASLAIPLSGSAERTSVQQPE